MKTVLFCLLMLSAYVASAQSFTVTPADVQRKESFLLMRDGTVMKGQILRQDSSIISVRRRGGDMSFVEADQVVSVSGKQPVTVGGTVGQTRYQTFIFRDGTQIEGTFVSRDSTMITVRKRSGRLTYFEPELLLQTDSTTVATTTEAVDSYTNRFPTWMLNGQTAYNPEKGRFYYRNTWLLLNEFTYGITSFWSVSANFVTPIPYLLVRDTYAGGGSSYVQNNTSLSTRFSAALGRQVHLAVTASYRQPRGYPEGRGEGTFRGLLTLGSSQNNITLGYGLVTTRAEFPSYVNPPYYSGMPSYIMYRIPDRSFLTIGLVQKLSRSLTLISDNQIRLNNVAYYTDSNWKTALSLALRIDRPRHAFDLGLSGLINQRGDYVNGRRVNVLPYLAYNLIIGRP